MSMGELPVSCGPPPAACPAAKRADKTAGVKKHVAARHISADWLSRFARFTLQRRGLPYRLWRLQRDALRSRFETLGIPVAHWEPTHAGVELAIEEVITLRRHARPVARV
jgi:hypothetical protein